jgi:hypothetical protein
MRRVRSFRLFRSQNVYRSQYEKSPRDRFGRRGKVDLFPASARTDRTRTDSSRPALPEARCSTDRDRMPIISPEDRKKSSVSREKPAKCPVRFSAGREIFAVNPLNFINQCADRSAQTVSRSAQTVDHSAQTVDHSARNVNRFAQTADHSAQSVDCFAQTVNHSAQTADHSAVGSEKPAQTVNRSAQAYPFIISSEIQVIVARR